MKQRILVIDDEAAIRDSMRMILEYEGYECILAPTAQEGLTLVEREPPDLVFLDIKMPGMDGLEALTKIKTSNDALPVVMISGHGTASTGWEAHKLGAFAFIEKPLGREQVLVTVKNALEQERLRDENKSLRRALDARHQMVGESAALKQVGDAIKRAAPTNATVLILGGGWLPITTARCARGRTEVLEVGVAVVPGDERGRGPRAGRSSPGIPSCRSVCAPNAWTTAS